MRVRNIVGEKTRKKKAGRAEYFTLSKEGKKENLQTCPQQPNPVLSCVLNHRPVFPALPRPKRGCACAARPGGWGVMEWTDESEGRRDGGEKRKGIVGHTTMQRRKQQAQWKAPPQVWIPSKYAAEA